MAGGNQHEIPRLYQRGFLIPNMEKAERIFVFRRGGRSFDRNIEKVGYQEHFYSEPDPNGGRTLDDEITDYEKRLAALVRTLRATELGAEVDGDIVAEVIAHLTFRNAHVREVYTLGASGMLGLASEVIQDDDLLRQFMGLDGPTGSDHVRKQIAEKLLQDPRVQALGVPLPLFERLILALVREHFATLMAAQRPMFLQALAGVLDDAPKLAKEGHNKALSKPDAEKTPREVWLASLQWRVVESAVDLILPDCVALGMDVEGKPLPLAIGGIKEFTSVAAPLTSRRLLVGSPMSSASTFDVNGFNEAAAACSHTYFLCASQTPDTLALLGIIGTRSTASLDAVIAEGPLAFVKGDGQEIPPTGVFGRALTPADHSFAASFNGDFDTDTAAKIVDAVRAIILNPTWNLPLSKVAAITFADDYATVLLAIDQGDANLPPPVVPRRDERAQGMGQMVHVRRDGEYRCHIVFDGVIGRALIADNDDLWEYGATVVANLFARAGFTAIYEATFGDDRPTLSPPEAEMHEVMRDAWKTYLAAHASAVFAPSSLALAQGNVEVAFSDMDEGLAVARDALEKTGDYGALWRSVAPLGSSLISQLGFLAGCAHGLDVEPLAGANALRDLLRSRGLLAWFEDYARDLDRTWKRRGQWRSYDELLALDRHAERLLWAFGVVLWDANDGCRVNILPAEIAETFAAAWANPQLF